jgi:LysR family transcriptional activator of glutamate synthase operon
MMNLDDLRAFVVLADLEHMTDAAATLRMPQPTLSRAVARLEAEVGVPLFDRPGRRLRLNPSGRVLREHAARALGELDTGTRRLASMRDPARGSVRLGFVGSVGTWLVPRILTHYRASVPGTTVQLTSAATDDLVRLLRTDRLDLALLGPAPGADDLDWRPLTTQRLCLAVPAGHRLAGRDVVGLAEVADEQFLTYRADTGMRWLSDRLCRQAGIRPAVALEGNDVATVDALVAAGMGVALRPEESGTPALPGVVHLALSDPGASRVVGVALPRERSGSAAVTRLVDLALEALRPGPPATG